MQEILRTDINQPSRVIILGYGFDEENNQNIGLDFDRYIQKNVRFAYTNHEDSQRIERKFITRIEHKPSWHLETARFQKSIRTVAEALQKDFDFTKQTLIKMSEHLDKLEKSYELLLTEYQSRKDGIKNR